MACYAGAVPLFFSLHFNIFGKQADKSNVQKEGKWATGSASRSFAMPK